MQEQTIFDLLYPRFKIDKPIRLITLFSGYDSQALSLKYLGIKFEHWKTCEWAVKSIQALKDLHFGNDKRDYSESFDIDEIKAWLLEKGISHNYNEPMTENQIKRMAEGTARNIFNNIIATRNLVNIQQVKGKDLEVKDTNKYCYIMTYSFPCQDLSLAGKGKGMSDTSTRSGMLWEVERILTEMNEKPQVLLMENVPQVHSEENREDFKRWIQRLEELGYQNYWQDLIATDYGIPQTRNRCFMVSLLGNYSYAFPPKQELKIRLKDLLEDNVDEKYYISDKMLECFMSEGTGSYPRKERFLQNINRKNQDIANSLTTLEGSRPTCTFIKIKNATKKGYLEGTEGDGVDISSRMQYHRGTVQKGKIQTITTSGGENLGVIVNKPRVIGGIGEKDSNNNTQWKQQNRVYDDNLSISITTSYNPFYKNDLRIRKLTPRECFRLMGVKDKDFNKIKKNQSDSSLYHLAGDSIVVDVLEAIINEMK